MFKEALRDVVEHTQGGQAGLLMGFDGIAVESHVRDGVDINIETIGMEMSVVLKQLMHAVESVQAGTAQELAIQSEKLTLIVRVLNNDYYLALAVAPDGNYGKARFLLRLAAPKILSALE
jgi:predicted regulator of Ras-like GTPase activity (Roadblock/LC7/MglB family)